MSDQRVFNSTGDDVTGLPDLQNCKDTRGEFIDKVGVRGVQVPISIHRKDGEVLDTSGTFSIYTSLSEEIKGANMSRYGQTLMKALENNTFSLDVIEEMLYVLQKRLKSNDSYIKVRFPFFIKKKSPTTDNWSWSPYNCIIEGTLKEKQLDFYLTAEVYVMSVCPCSKGMSLEDPKKGIGRGAHYQRSLNKVTIHLSNHKKPVWLEDLIDLVERQGSCQIFNILKRPDEKYVTERAYDNPKFVEDICRDIALAIRGEMEEKVDGWVIVTDNEESIHTYNAVAITRGGIHYIQ